MAKFEIVSSHSLKVFMSKPVLIGLVAVALGIGGIALLSGKSGDASSETLSADHIATVPAQPVAVVEAPLAGPFERSAAICATGKYMCVTFNGRVDGRTAPVTVLDMIPGINSWERVKILNGWSETEVTLDTVVPIGTTIAFNEQPSK